MTKHKVVNFLKSIFISFLIILLEVSCYSYVAVGGAGSSGAGTETDPYIVGLPDNLFYANSGNYNGLNVNYDKNSQVLTLDGNFQTSTTQFVLYNYLFLR